MFKVTKEVLESCEALVTVEVEEAVVQAAMQKAARNIASENPFPGFRKGKVPYNMILSRFGAPALRREAAELVLEDIYADVLEQAEVYPVGPGSLEDIALEPLVLKIRVPLAPLVELGDYGDLRLEMEPHEVTDAELDEAMEHLRTEHTVAEPVSRPAALGDRVTLEHIEAKANDEVFIHDHDVSVILDPEDRTIVPGLVGELVGLSAGEEKMFHLTMPEDFSEQSLRSADAEFTVRMESVSELTTPALNDAFASAVGNFETFDELKADLRERLQAYKHDQAHEAYHKALAGALVERATKVLYPDVLLQEELDENLSALKARMPQHLGMPWEDFLRLQGMTEEQFRDSLRPSASQRLTERLVLEEFARREGITVSEQELRGNYEQLLAALQIPARDRRPFSLDLMVVEESRKQLLRAKALARLEGLAQADSASSMNIRSVEPDSLAAEA